MFVDKSLFAQKLSSAISGKDSSVALAADNDLDGLTAACLLDMALYELYEVEVDTCFRHELSWEIDWQQLPESAYDIGVFLDLAFGNTPNYRNIASTVNHCFAIDHHISNEVGFPQKVTAYNPCRNAECYLPTAWLAKEIIQDLGHVPSPVVDYLVLLGVLSDSGIYFNLTPDNELKLGYSPELAPYFDKAISQFPNLFKKEVFGSFKYPAYRDILAAVNREATELGWAEIYLQFVNASEELENLEEIIDQIHAKYAGEYEQILADLPSEPTETSSSGIWILKNPTTLSNGAIARTIVEMISQPIVVYKCAKLCYIAARAPHGSPINFIPAFENVGGGHQGACGAVISQKDFEPFLEIIRAL
ncbi:MAG: hypothetical protein ACE5OZ_03715 [Candidatus Heimdallarchaeota archaeon]